MDISDMTNEQIDQEIIRLITTETKDYKIESVATLTCKGINTKISILSILKNNLNYRMYKEVLNKKILLDNLQKPNYDIDFDKTYDNYVRDKLLNRDINHCRVALEYTNYINQYKKLSSELVELLNKQTTTGGSIYKKSRSRTRNRSRSKKSKSKSKK
jgi:hypothetical protein